MKVIKYKKSDDTIFSGGLCFWNLSIIELKDPVFE